ncbi:MAG: MerR family transcriptional regulator [Aquabacterium sp.]
MDRIDSVLPPIPAKRYFTIGEVSELCLVKPYVLRYWEQEFVQLKPMKRRGNRRYYQHHEVLLIRRIRELLYEQGFTISGARNQLSDMGALAAVSGADHPSTELMGAVPQGGSAWATSSEARTARALQAANVAVAEVGWLPPDLAALDRLDADSAHALRDALVSIRELLG